VPVVTLQLADSEGERPAELGQEHEARALVLSEVADLLVRLAGVEPATLGLEVLAPEPQVVVVSCGVNDVWQRRQECAVSREVARGCGQ
jgi:hypothetical protein